ncbi:MAG: HEAT repeat domain-containing protein, partial [Verrucomicrobiales bacterium]|nr:HEAT repeat domain-containing protein [Verrucomicrobiales bacterium]
AEPRIVETLLGLLERVAERPRQNPPQAHGPYAQAVLHSQPDAYWRLEEMVIPQAADATSHGRNARFELGLALHLPGPGSGEGVSPAPALMPSAFSGPALINRAVHCAGGRLRAALPGLGSTYTVEFWFWNGLAPTHRAVTGYLFSRGVDGDPQALGDHLGIGGTAPETPPGRLFVFNGNQRLHVLAGHTPLRERTWYHVALVREGTRVRVHLNGDASPEIEGDLESTLPFAPNELFFGGRSDHFAGLEGRIDEVAVYARSLTTAEITAHTQASGLPLARATPPTRPTLASPPLSPQESLAKLHLSPGFKAELAAAEPLVLDPVAIDWDAEGRLWVVEMADYPLGLDGHGQPGGRVRVLTDTNADGVYDQSRVFAEGLRFPNGLLVWRDGVLVTAAPEVLFLKDSDGDGTADVREVLLSGFLEGNQQLRVNGLRWGVDNWVYCAAGGHHRGHGAGTRVRSHRNGTEIALGSRDFRFHPDTGEIEPESGPSQFGRNPDDWGHWFGTQNSWPLWHYVLADGYLRRNPHIPAPDPVSQVIRPMNPQVFPASTAEKRFHSFNEAGHFTSACAGSIYRDELVFPRGDTVHALTCEPFHNLVHRAIVHDDGVSFSATRDLDEASSEWLASEDRWFRPVMTRTGPDGAVWVVDMYRYMIEHPEWLPPEGRAELLPHYRAGDDRGRLYRITRTDAPPRARATWSGLDAPRLVAHHASPNGWVRDHVQQRLLWLADPAAVPPLRQLASSSPAPLGRLHALWTLHGLRALPQALLRSALTDPHPRVRENALRMAEAGAEPETIRTAARLTTDPDDKVRLQLALSLGAWSDSDAGDALVRLAGSADTNAYLRGAVLSSAVPHAERLIAAYA